MDTMQLARIDFAVELAEKAGTSVTISGGQARELLDHLVAVTGKCNAMQVEKVKLQRVINSAYRVFHTDIVERVAERVEEILASVTTVPSTWDEPDADA